MEREESELAEIRATYDLEKVLALVRLCKNLQESAGADLVSLLSTHTSQEVADFLRLIESAKEFGCNHEEIITALRLWKRTKIQHARYYEKHKAEVNKKQAARTRARRNKEKSEKATDAAK